MTTYGIGLNDVNYKVTLTERLPCGKYAQVWRCPYYEKWHSMFMRCYSSYYLEKQPTYRGCVVCEEWLLFSNFRKWMVGQEWRIPSGKALHLDKDFLVEGNKIYSPETCIFLHQRVNNFRGDCAHRRGSCLLGTSWSKVMSKFESCIKSPFSKKKNKLGYYESELEAHFAWKKQKHIYSCELANSEYVTDERVRQVLLHRYENYKVVEDHLK